MDDKSKNMKKEYLPPNQLAYLNELRKEVDRMKGAEEKLTQPNRSNYTKKKHKNLSEVRVPNTFNSTAPPVASVKRRAIDKFIRPEIRELSQQELVDLCNQRINYCAETTEMIGEELNFNKDNLSDASSWLLDKDPSGEWNPWSFTLNISHVKKTMSKFRALDTFDPNMIPCDDGIIFLGKSIRILSSNPMDNFLASRNQKASSQLDLCNIVAWKSTEREIQVIFGRMNPTTGRSNFTTLRPESFFVITSFSAKKFKTTKLYLSDAKEDVSKAIFAQILDLFDEQDTYYSSSDKVRTIHFGEPKSDSNLLIYTITISPFRTNRPPTYHRGGSHADYSHRFDVRAHKRVIKNKQDASDKRQVWVKGHIRGGKGKPYIKKKRIWKI